MVIISFQRGFEECDALVRHAHAQIAVSHNVMILFGYGRPRENLDKASGFIV